MIPSEKYAVDTTTTTDNGVTLKWTKQIKDMYEFGDGMDLSIAYAHYVYRIMNKVFRKMTWDDDRDMCIPSHGQNPSGANDYLSGWKRSRDLNPVKAPYCGVVFTNKLTNYNEDGHYYTGVNVDKPEAIVERSHFGDKRLLVNFDVNNMLFRVRIYGYRVDDWDNIDYDEDPINGQQPEIREISLKELYEHPEDYEVAYWKFAGTWIYNKETGTWGSDFIYPSLIISDGGVDTEGFSGDIPFMGQTPTFTFSHRDKRGIGITGGNDLNFCCRLDEHSYILGFVDEFEIDPCKYYSYAGLVDELGSIGDDIFGVVDRWNSDLFFEHTKYILGDTILHLCTKGHNVSYNPDAPIGQLSHGISSIISHGTWVMDGWEACSYLASFGAYFTGDWEYNPNVNHLTPEDFPHDENIMLGAMSDDGLTTGIWLVGEPLEDYDGYNKDGTTVNPSYIPRIPTPPTQTYKGRRIKIILPEYSKQIKLKTPRRNCR